MAKKYAVVDIGCIECGEHAEVVGVYRSKLEADAVYEKRCEEMDAKFGGYFDGGQREIEVIEVNKPVDN